MVKLLKTVKKFKPASVMVARCVCTCRKCNLLYHWYNISNLIVFLAVYLEFRAIQAFGQTTCDL